jgi:tRNA-dihydrouridine synthase B
MNIGHLQLKNNVFLAPMAGITDLPFRTIVRSFGCGLAFTEMVSASGSQPKSWTPSGRSADDEAR